MSRVLLGMSGGIDSTVSAMLLMEQGHEVVGVTYRTYDSIKESCLAREKGCCSIDSIMEARNNAHKMGFEHHIVDYRDVFQEHVIQNFCDEYMAGRTPNPCVLCNCHIKWGEMLRKADELGCDYIATGHYARVEEREGHYYLQTAVDQRKDQTYFLWMLTEEQLRRTIFPLGGLTKDEVREIARQHGYVKLAEKKESQEICFVTDNDYRRFLRETVADYEKRVQPGHFIDAAGTVVGQHQGFCNYTIGQRKGLGIALGKPVFVTKIDAARNEVTLGDNEDLLQEDVRLSCALFRGNADKPFEARIRYRSAATEAVVADYDEETKEMAIRFLTPVWGVTPGQSCVIYQDGNVVGGGFIR